MAGSQSRGQPPWIPGTLKTMIPDRPWATPPESSTPDCSLHPSVLQRLPQPAVSPAELSALALALSAVSPSPLHPSPLPAGSGLTLKEAAPVRSRALLVSLAEPERKPGLAAEQSVC
ncbi:unnamed protein product [Pleuronectes platessa]|uniref:Uncharacterized protein n=1 Tax=Pleuronectes platessa TaxID=8262 RepID=A0A9N7USA8_PLEPL|nr:unnamed protein product [Pleuronectes platessa]